MKFASKLIPTPPSPPSRPSAPNAPTPPDAGQMPAGSNSQSIPGSGGIPGGGEMPSITAKIAQGIPGGSRGISADQIRAAMASINLDDYRDENGEVTCPVPKADREKMISDLKKIADNH